MIIREVFVQTGSPPMGELRKKQAALTKQTEAEQARRKKAQAVIDAEINRIVAKAHKGDASRVREIPALNQQIRDLWSAPYPSQLEQLAMLDMPLDEVFKHPVIDARKDPQASFVCKAAASEGSFPLPTVFQ